MKLVNHWITLKKKKKKSWANGDTVQLHDQESDPGLEPALFRFYLFHFFIFFYLFHFSFHAFDVLAQTSSRRKNKKQNKNKARGQKKNCVLTFLIENKGIGEGTKYRDIVALVFVRITLCLWGPVKTGGGETGSMYVLS